MKKMDSFPIFATSCWKSSFKHRPPSIWDWCCPVVQVISIFGKLAIVALDIEIRVTQFFTPQRITGK